MPTDCFKCFCCCSHVAICSKGSVWKYFIAGCESLAGGWLRMKSPVCELTEARPFHMALDMATTSSSVVSRHYTKNICTIREKQKYTDIQNCTHKYQSHSSTWTIGHPKLTYEQKCAECRNRSVPFNPPCKALGRAGFNISICIKSFFPSICQLVATNIFADGSVVDTNSILSTEVRI